MKKIALGCKKIIKSLAIKTVKAEVNATCPFISYQPKLPQVVLKLKNDE